jgi:hypothetical protein
VSRWLRQTALILCNYRKEILQESMQDGLRVNLQIGRSFTKKVRSPSNTHFEGFQTDVKVVWTGAAPTLRPALRRARRERKRVS